MIFSISFLENPGKNRKELLIGEVKRLGELDDGALRRLAKKAKEEKIEIETKQDEMTKQKYWVT